MPPKADLLYTLAVVIAAGMAAGGSITCALLVASAAFFLVHRRSTNTDPARRFSTSFGLPWSHKCIGLDSEGR